MKKFAGIEINDDSLSAMILSQGTNVEKHEHIKFSDLKSDPDDHLKEALEQISEYITPDCYVSVSISPKNFYIRNIKVPFDNKEKINKIISYELDPHLPSDIDQIETDFKLINENTIISVSCDNSRLNKYFEILNNFNIQPDVLTVSGLPWAEFYSKKFDTKENILIYVNYGDVTLFFFGENGVSFIKNIYGSLNNENISSKIVLEIKLSIQSYFESTGLEFDIKNVMVTGYGSDDYDFNSIFRDTFNVDIQKKELHKLLDLSEFTDSIYTLALYEKEKVQINLCESKNKFIRFYEENMQSIIKSGIILGFLLIMILINSFSYINDLNKRADNYDLKMKQIFQRSFPKVKRIIDPLMQMRSKVKELQKKNPVASSDIGKLDILNEVSKAIPESLNVDLNRLNISANNLSISGQTDTFISVESLKKKLENIPFFESVTMSSPSKSRVGNKINFRLTIKIKKD
ncbi:MAG: hypothetical protein GY714_25755 [Desulfobacterales bacterium]|nr:hypothetical protein [Desulfobacterales bacterium]